MSAVRRPALRVAQHRALGRKVSDEFTVPLCRGIIAATPIWRDPTPSMRPVPSNRTADLFAAP